MSSHTGKQLWGLPSAGGRRRLLCLRVDGPLLDCSSADCSWLPLKSLNWLPSCTISQASSWPYLLGPLPCPSSSKLSNEQLLAGLSRLMPLGSDPLESFSGTPSSAPESDCLHSSNNFLSRSCQLFCALGKSLLCTFCARLDAKNSRARWLGEAARFILCCLRNSSQWCT